MFTVIYKSNSMSIVKALEKHTGVEWEYCKSSYYWRRKDGKAHLAKVLTGKDMEGEYTGDWQWCLYQDGKAPEWTFFTNVKK